MNTQHIKLIRKLRNATPESLRPIIAYLLPASLEHKLKAAVQPRYFCVRGHPRSGTNWVGKLLNLHPDIWCDGEFHFDAIYHALKRSTTLPWQITYHDPVRSELEACFGDMVRRCVRAAALVHRPSALWFGDRTSQELIHWLGDCRYIWVLRDGRDVAVSWTFHQIRLGPDVIDQTYFPQEIKGFLCALSTRFKSNPNLFDEQPELLLSDKAWVELIAYYWDKQYQGDLDEAAKLAQPDADGQVLRIRYEDIHTDTQAQCDRLYRFLDLDPAMAKPFSSDANATPGFARHDPNSYQRKGSIGDWKNYFTDESLRWFEDIAGQSLADANYVLDARQPQIAKRVNAEPAEHSQRTQSAKE